MTYVVNRNVSSEVTTVLVISFFVKLSVFSAFQQRHRIHRRRKSEWFLFCRANCLPSKVG